MACALRQNSLLLIVSYLSYPLKGKSIFKQSTKKIFKNVTFLVKRNRVYLTSRASKTQDLISSQFLDDVPTGLMKKKKTFKKQ